MDSELKRKSLFEVLKDTGLSKLPNIDEGKKVWVKAVALVLKNDGSETYCILKKTSIDTYKIQKDYGKCSPINRILEIYPYQYIDSSFIPKFGPNDKESRISFIINNSKTTDEYNNSLRNMTVKELNIEMAKLLIDKM